MLSPGVVWLCWRSNCKSCSRSIVVASKGKCKVTFASRGRGSWGFRAVEVLDLRHSA